MYNTECGVFTALFHEFGLTNMVLSGIINSKMSGIVFWARSEKTLPSYNTFLR